jgi:hypothetical protein
LTAVAHASVEQVLFLSKNLSKIAQATVNRPAGPGSLRFPPDERKIA